MVETYVSDLVKIRDYLYKELEIGDLQSEAKWIFGKDPCLAKCLAHEYNLQAGNSFVDYTLPIGSFVYRSMENEYSEGLPPVTEEIKMRVLAELETADIV
jgi:hypothetical protein